MRDTENQARKIAARLPMKLPREGLRIPVVVTAAGETTWNRDAGMAVLDSNGRTAWIRLGYR